jgi:hypothetical protein
VPNFTALALLTTSQAVMATSRLPLSTWYDFRQMPSSAASTLHWVTLTRSQSVRSMPSLFQ